MGYAEVAVNSPIAQRQTFSYAIPPYTDLKVGQAVWVPFGARVLQGIVFQLTDHPTVEETREIVGVIEPLPLLSSSQIELARWISEHYLAPLFDAAALMLPPGFERKLVTFLYLSPKSESSTAAPLTPDQRQLLDRLEKEGKTTLGAVEKALGKKKARLVVDQLLRKGLVIKSQELERIKVKPKGIPYLKLAVEPELARQQIQISKAPRQAALLELLINKQPVSLQEAKRSVHCTPSVMKAPEDKGLISKEQVQVRRDPLLHRFFPP
ncbi:MAG TPA: hypothetical protein VJ441_01465, partial [Dehalococcoidia bacterium]|nr:hypothetical protein [Dehalococcoidia bacterium]